MPLQLHHALTLPQMISPLFIALIWIAAFSLLKEPARRNFSAIMVAGAGAAYLNGGLGGWEFAFCALITFMAYRGLSDYRFIGVAWILHACWDVVHHLYGNPIVPFAPSSSAGCAICDPVIGLWYICGAQSIATWFRHSDARACRLHSWTRGPSPLIPADTKSPSGLAPRPTAEVAAAAFLELGTASGPGFHSNHSRETRFPPPRQCSVRKN